MLAAEYMWSSLARSSCLRAFFSAFESPSSDSPCSYSLRRVFALAETTRTEPAAARAGLADAADFLVAPVKSRSWVRLLVALRIVTYSFPFMLTNSVPVMIWYASR